MPARQSTPPITSITPPLVLCADGGGSKICIVIRSEDGLEVRGVAGPCNVQSVGYAPATQQILLATYRALSQLPSSHLPIEAVIPTLPPIEVVQAGMPNGKMTTLPLISAPVTPHISRAPSPASSTSTSPGKYCEREETPLPLPPLNVGLFRHAWLGLAGITTSLDVEAFTPWVANALAMPDERIKITNDVNLLAAPALQLPGIRHVAAVVCGTGTVGRTIEVTKPEDDAMDGRGDAVRQLPLVDIGVSRGWGWLLCDEGSAFWIGRLAIRSLLFAGDRAASSGLHSRPPPPLSILHRDLLDYFGTDSYMDIINVVSLNDNTFSGVSIGTATARRNALMAGAARIVFRHAFPADRQFPPSPPLSEGGYENGHGCNGNGNGNGHEDDGSRKEALKIARSAIRSLVDLTLDLLGDGSVVCPRTTALALGGGLWQSEGYRSLLIKGLKSEGVEFRDCILVGDAAGVGARGLASVEFGH